MSTNIVLVLGAGPNTGYQVTKYFSDNFYKTAAVARNPSEQLVKAADLVVNADFSDVANMKAIFDEVKEKLGIPNVVVYNGECLSYVHIKLEECMTEDIHLGLLRQLSSRNRISF